MLLKKKLRKRINLQLIVKELIDAYSLVIDCDKVLSSTKGRITEFFPVDDIFFFRKNCKGNYEEFQDKNTVILQKSKLIFWLNNNTTCLELKDSLLEYVTYNIENLDELNLKYIFPVKSHNQLILIAAIKSKTLSKKYLDIIEVVLRLCAMAYENSLQLTKELKNIDDLYEKKKIATIERMTSSIAHEIKNPLTYIRSMVQFLLENSEENQTKDTFRTIMEEVDSVNSITERLVEFSRPVEVEISSFSINDLVKKVAELFKSKLEEDNISFKIDIEDKKRFFIKGDFKAFKQVLVNFMLNSIDALKDINEKEIKFKFFQQSEGVYVIQWIDNGIGIPQGLMDKILDPFFTNKPKGTGMGLSVCQQILQKHNYFFEILSKQNKGTIIIIYVELDRIDSHW